MMKCENAQTAIWNTMEERLEESIIHINFKQQPQITPVAKSLKSLLLQ